MKDLSLAQLRAVGVARSTEWHKDGLTEWSALEWAGAMAGEAGEACNVAKKIRRLELGAAARGSETDMEALKLQLGDELADTLIYLDLLAARCAISLAEAVVRKFNRTSEEFHFSQRLVLGDVRVRDEPRQVVDPPFVCIECFGQGGDAGSFANPCPACGRIRPLPSREG